MSEESGPRIIIRQGSDKAPLADNAESGFERFLRNTPPYARYLIALGIAGLAIAYVVSPVDLLPAAAVGPVGAVDDLAVVVAAVRVGLSLVTGEAKFLKKNK